MELSGNPLEKRVWIDLVKGEAQLGSITLPVAIAGAQGELRLGEPQGVVLRPLRFLERSRAVRRALQTPDPILSLSAEALQLALVQPGEGNPLALQVLALHLAGAGAWSRMVSFAETALALGRAGAWALAQIEQAEAAFVDHLAEGLVAEAELSPTSGSAPSSALADRQGWTTLLFTPRPEDELESLRRILAEDLLQRGRPAATPTQSLSRLAISNLDSSQPVDRRPETDPGRYRSEAAAFKPRVSVELSQHLPPSRMGETIISNASDTLEESSIDESMPVKDELSPLEETSPQTSAVEGVLTPAGTPPRAEQQAPRFEEAAAKEPSMQAASNSLSLQTEPDAGADLFEPYAPGIQPWPAVLPGIPVTPLPQQRGRSLVSGPGAPPRRASGVSDPAVPGVYLEYPEPQANGFSGLPGAIAQAELYDLSSLDEVAEALAALLRDEADLRGIDP
jgi:hypothetical protein